MLSQIGAGLNLAAGAIMPDGRISDGHRLEEMIQHFVGCGQGTNGGAFIWERVDHSKNPDFLVMLLGVLKDVHSSLAERLKRLTGEVSNRIEEEGSWQSVGRESELQYDRWPVEIQRESSPSPFQTAGLGSARIPSPEKPSSSVRIGPVHLDSSRNFSQTQVVEESSFEWEGKVSVE